MEFQNLPQFYQSQEWRKFRQVVIAERINKEDGILYDEYSGKPILKPYEIILHHKIELTITNVNDRSISLNPENIMIVSPKSHNEIHNRWGGRLEKYQRKVYYVYGAPCAGKNTFVRNSMNEGDLVLDIDSLWQCLSGLERYKKPNELKNLVFAAYQDILDLIKMRTGYWQQAFVIEGGALANERKRRIENLGAESIFIDSDKETCLNRLANDKSRISVQKQWAEYINNWFTTYQPDELS